MWETLLLICSLAVVVPVLLVTITVYNLNRKLQGKGPLTGEEVLQNIINKIKKFFSDRSKLKNQSEKKDNIEDAEFREVK